MAQAEARTSTQASARPSPIRIKKLGHVVIQVRNLERSMRFHTEVMKIDRLEKARDNPKPPTW